MLTCCCVRSEESLWPRKGGKSFTEHQPREARGSHLVLWAAEATARDVTRNDLKESVVYKVDCRLEGIPTNGDGGVKAMGDGHSESKDRETRSLSYEMVGSPL